MSYLLPQFKHTAHFTNVLLYK